MTPRTCPRCGLPLTPWPRDTDGRLWLRCLAHGYWRTAAGVPLLPSDYQPMGAADDLPLCPDLHGEETTL